MSTWPRPKVGPHLWRGASALALFGVLSWVFLAAEFTSPAGFADVENITALIGYALFAIPNEGLEATGTETFLVAFVVVAVVLDAALEAAVMLARREEAGEVVSALRPGGEE